MVLILYLPGSYSLLAASNMNPQKIIGCSQPYDIEELLVALSDMGQANIKEYFDVASQKIGKFHFFKFACFKNRFYKP